MQELRRLFMGYTPIYPEPVITPFSLSALDCDCPPDVRPSLEAMTEITTYKFNGNVIRFFHQGEDCSVHLQHIARFLHKLQVKPVIADILFSPVKKYYPPDKVFDKSHTNTGYCTGDKVVVYRREEWFKVFIHECVHYFQWEQVLKQPSPEMLTLFHRPFHLFEAYCEVCARVLNCCYISAITRIPVACLYEIERQYSIQHMVNVLHHMNMDYTMLFDARHEFKEKTNLFAYVVITAMLMYARYVPPYTSRKLELLKSEPFNQVIVKTAKRKSFYHEATSRVPSVTTTMSKLNVDEFIPYH
jgi:hypothetical protein